MSISIMYMYYVLLIINYLNLWLNIGLWLYKWIQSSYWDYVPSKARNIWVLRPPWVLYINFQFKTYIANELFDSPLYMYFRSHDDNVLVNHLYKIHEGSITAQISQSNYESNWFALQNKLVVTDLSLFYII